MMDNLERAIYASVGMAYLTKEKVQELAAQLAKDAKASEAEGKKFVDDIQKHAESAKSSAEGFVREHVAKIMEQLDLPTRTELDQLKARIAELEKALDKKD